MEMMEKVESLREKTGVSYSEAKAALEQTGGDLLEALCWLETHGKTQLVGTSCSTDNRVPPEPEPEPETPREPGPFVRGFRSLWEGIVRLLRWGNQNTLVMCSKQGVREVAIPLTLVIILVLVAFWIVAAAVVVALFCGCRFSVEGPGSREDLNDALGRATDFAEGIKEEAFPREDHDA